MKSLILAAVLVTSFSALAADISCTGSVEGKNIEFVMGRNDAGEITSMNALIDGVSVSKLSGAEVKVSEHVYGTMVSGWPANSYNADHILVLLDKPRPGEEVSNLGWISLMNRGIELRGIDLNCVL